MRGQGYSAPLNAPVSAASSAFEPWKALLTLCGSVLSANAFVRLPAQKGSKPQDILGHFLSSKAKLSKHT